jgi:hypothetical protein
LCIRKEEPWTRAVRRPNKPIVRFGGEKISLDRSSTPGFIPSGMYFANSCRSTTKQIQINALNLGGEFGQPSGSGENPPIRKEKARPFCPSTIKVSGEKPANAREFQSPPWAESMFS